MNPPANPVADQAQRQRALNIKESFIVQAPAGSGKTELLTQRFLALLAQVRSKPEEILAITFTRKAAAEMRDRIVAALTRATAASVPRSPHEATTFALAQAVLQRDETEQWHLLAHPERLRIQTIDAFYASVTRQLPVLAQFGTQPNITEEPRVCYQQAVRNLLASLAEDTPWAPSLAELLMHLDNHFDKVEKLLINMLARRDQWLESIFAIKYAPDSRSALEQTLQQINLEILAALAASVPPALQDELLTLARYAAENLADPALNLTQLPGTTLAHKAQWLALAEWLLTKEFALRKSIDKRQGFPKAGTMKQRMQALLENLAHAPQFCQALANLMTAPPLQYSDEQWNLISALVQLLPVLAAQLQVVFKEQACVDYLEVAYSALRALGRPDDPTDLALAFDYRLQHILVDEFQDTSALQYQLLEVLTAGWQPGDGRTLFLVGDPMQSIYRFRKAEVGLFLRAAELGIGALPLTPLRLSVNFRAEGTLVAWINTIFADVLPKASDIALGAVPFNPSSAAKFTQPEQAVFVHPQYGTAADEANQLVALVQQALQQDTQGTVGILVRSRSHLTEILPALQQANIAYRAVEIAALAERSVIQDLLALTYALLHPGHRLAWLTVLRAPWCGLTLADLTIVAEAANKQALWQALQHYPELPLSTEGQHRLAKIVLVLTESLQQRRRLPLREWVETTWLLLGGPACLAEQTALQEAKIFFNLLAKLDEGADLPDLLALEEKLQQLYADAVPVSACRVEVMTIHKAKGLEFDTVIVPGLHKPPRHEDSPLLLWMEQYTLTGHRLLLSTIKAAMAKEDLIYNYLRRQENEKAHYESQRLLYVACTRAKKYLHLLGTVALNEHGQIKSPRSGSFLTQLWPQVAAIFQQGLAQHAAPELTRQAHAPVSRYLVRLPKLWFAGGESIRTPMQAALIESTNPTQLEPDPPTAWPYLTAQQTGTLIHRLLKQISEEGLAAWDNAKIMAQQPRYRLALMQQGVLPECLDAAVATVVRALTQCLSDERGRWILTHTHQAAQSEYALTHLAEDKAINLVLDRTFIDAQGQRWIIDYKTTDYIGNNLNEFLDAERLKHQAQLHKYAALFSKTETRPIRLGLYFPLVQGWREWQF